MTSNNKLKIYLIAGEPSGDLLGSRFMRAMHRKLGDKVEFYGVGGDTMEKEGLTPLFDISDLAVMGLVEIIPSIPKILGLINQTINDIKAVKPDVVMTIDSWSFSERIHKKLRKLKLGIPQVHYVAPQVWAWKKRRARTCGRYIDRLMALLPYEPQYFEPYGLKTDFVGHPVVEGGAAKGDGKRFRSEHGISEETPVLCVLPGSRRSETKYLLPVFKETVGILSQKYPQMRVVVPTVATVKQKVSEAVSDWALKVDVVTGETARYDAFAASSAALAASGTVALELALARVPYTIAYKMNPISSYLARRLVTGKFANLVNIMANQEVVKEYLLENCRPTLLAAEIERLLENQAYRDAEVNKAFDVLKTLGAQDGETPSDKAADIVLSTALKK